MSRLEPRHRDQRRLKARQIKWNPCPVEAMLRCPGIGTDYQVADIFTKPLAHAKFRAFREVLCGYRSYEQLLNSNEEKQAEIRQLQAYDFQLQNQISLAGHPLAHLC